MLDHDLIVLGGGTGNLVASAAADEDLDVGLVERDRLGGTCLNRGCNPSKKLIHRANVAETVRTAEAVGIEATLEDVAFEQIVDDVETTITEAAESKAVRAREHPQITLYQCEGRFVDEKQIDVADTDELLTADTIVLAGGSRPLIPDSIDGLAETPFLTSADALYLDSLPDRLVIVGGGYIAVEMSHFFGQMGADVTIIGSGDVLLTRADRAIAEQLTDAYRTTHDLILDHRATAITDDDGQRIVTAESTAGEKQEVTADQILLATGRQPNSDQWNVTAAGIETDEAGFVETDAVLETSVDGIYAIGDIAGNYMFKHSGDTEAAHVVDTVVNGDETPVEYPGMAHAVFGSPQVASLGQTEAELEQTDIDYSVGTYAYDDTALGVALRDEGGFVKVLVADDGEVVGCHIVGPEASTLIHEVSTAVAAGADATTLAKTIHVHPALSEVVQGAFREVRDVAPTGI